MTPKHRTYVFMFQNTCPTWLRVAQNFHSHRAQESDSMHLTDTLAGAVEQNIRAKPEVSAPDSHV